MAKLPIIKRISKEDLKEAPSWLDKVLYPLNLFMESVYTALNKGLTFQDNFASQIKDVEFTTPTNYVSAQNFNKVTFVHSLKTMAIGISILSIHEKQSSAVIKNAVSLDWRDINGTININFVTGLEDNKKYIIRLLIL